jgi:hypothetical protein
MWIWIKSNSTDTVDMKLRRLKSKHRYPNTVILEHYHAATNIHDRPTAATKPHICHACGQSTNCKYDPLRSRCSPLKPVFSSQLSMKRRYRLRWVRWAAETDMARSVALKKSRMLCVRIWSDLTGRPVIALCWSCKCYVIFRPMDSDLAFDHRYCSSMHTGTEPTRELLRRTYRKQIITTCHVFNAIFVWA